MAIGLCGTRIEVGDEWIHYSGTTYVIVSIGNENAIDIVKFPMMINYRKKGGGPLWSRPLSDFICSCRLNKSAV